jgi:hypothetical protein
MGEMIFRAGESLRLPVSTTVVAACIAHYFYSRMGMLDHDFRDVALGATFLACKSEETLRKSYEVSTVYDHVFKVKLELCRCLRDSVCQSRGRC